MLIGKFQEYLSDKGVTIQSKRLIEEMKTFIWKNGRPEAQQGYNDDLVMSFGIAMYMRDTAFKFKQHGVDLTKSMLKNMASTKTNYNGVYQLPKDKNPWQIDNPYSNGKEDIRWLL
jgi:CO/xanthine dehydrogenase Mo-binding subunit